jgi:hypothetical protein
MRRARLEGAIGADMAADVARVDHVRSVLRLLDGTFLCSCGRLYDPLMSHCPCGRPTFSPYVRLVV